MILTLSDTTPYKTIKFIWNSHEFIHKQGLSLKKDARRSTNIIFFYEQYFTELT